MTTLEQVRAERIDREARAAERASIILPGDYYASGNKLIERGTRHVMAECETHWDAVMVMLAIERPAGQH